MGWTAIWSAGSGDRGSASLEALASKDLPSAPRPTLRALAINSQNGSHDYAASLDRGWIGCAGETGVTAVARPNQPP